MPIFLKLKSGLCQVWENDMLRRDDGDEFIFWVSG